MNHPFTRSRPGYTLIEVLTALAVIAALLPLCMQGVAQATRLGSQAKQRAQAADLAQSKLDELAITRTWRTGSLSGDFGPDWPGYQWNAAVADWNNTAVRELQVQVTWTGARGPQELAISTLVNAETP